MRNVPQNNKVSRNYRREPQMNRTAKEIILNSGKAVGGLMLFAVGVYLVIQSNLGAQPWDTLMIGLSERMGILYGNVSVALSAVLILIDTLILKEKIGLGTVLDAITVGKTVDLLNWLGPVPKMTSALIPRIALMLLGFCIEGLAQYIYMKQSIGYGPRDSLQIGLSRKLKRLSVGGTAVLINVSVLSAGWLLGGPVGVGTFIAPFGLGFTQQRVFDFMKFNPKTIVNQNIIESFRILSGASGKD